jgi:hypothetical protein
MDIAAVLEYLRKAELIGGRQVRGVAVIFPP